MTSKAGDAGGKKVTLIARAPVDDFDGTGDKRPGFVFEAPADVAKKLVEQGKAEEVAVEHSKK